MDVADQILVFLKDNGPSLPTRVAKYIKTDTLIASAHLSDLSSRKKLKISSLKVGGSPLYYLEGQEEMLFNFVQDNVNPKDFIVLERLKSEGILRENELDLLSKVAVRNLRDFAIPLQVRSSSIVEFFWKWHLLSSDEASKIIGGMITPKKEEVVEKEVVPEELLEKEVPVVEQENVPETKETESVVEQEVQENDVIQSEVVKEVKVPVEVKEIIEPEEQIKSEISKAELEPVSEIKESVETKESLETEESEDDFEEKKVERQKKLAKEDKIPLLKKLKDKMSRKKGVDDKFFPEIDTFFKGLKISIQQKETIRKNSEMNFIIKVPTPVGPMLYFCKAKSKAKCDEKDVSSAYMEAQIKKLPLLFLYTKELNKKAQEMLKSDAFQNALMKKIE